MIELGIHEPRLVVRNTVVHAWVDGRLFGCANRGRHLWRRVRAQNFGSWASKIGWRWLLFCLYTELLRLLESQTSYTHLLIISIRGRDLS